MTAVEYEKKGHVAYITLSRPEVLNAMNERMHADLALAWDEAEADDDVWVAVLAGAGHRAFSVGRPTTAGPARPGPGLWLALPPRRAPGGRPVLGPARCLAAATGPVRIRACCPTAEMLRLNTCGSHG